MGGAGAMHVAIDLGAGSGRALVGGAGAEGLRLIEAHRFHYAPRHQGGHLRWDAAALTQGILEGLAKAREAAASLGAPLASVGVDSWGVDYALVDQRGALVEEPICYRDSRTDRAMDEVFALVPRDEIFARTGIQFHQFNTLYQLWAHVREGLPPRAAHLLLTPDYCHHVLCGSLVSERTNASTTQLLSAATGAWDDELFARLGLPRQLMPESSAPARCSGRSGRGSPARSASARSTWSRPAPTTPRARSPARRSAADWAYISSGTWSLVGVELDAPILDGGRRAGADLTNEAGVVRPRAAADQRDGAVAARVVPPRVGSRGTAAGACGDCWTPPLAARSSAGVIFPDDRRFFAPDSMVRAIRGMLTETGQADTDDPVLITKVILDSLALRYASVVSAIERLTGRAIPGIHIVGGGSRNAYLNQATADASGREVLAGPVEATAIGNLLVQGIAAGTIGSLADGRGMVAEAFPPARFEPRDTERWEAPARLFGRLGSESNLA